jgi:hypothetical protein
MAAHPLKLQHHIGQLGVGYGSTGPLVTDVVILTKPAAQIAMREKERPRSMVSHERGLFTKMGGITGNPCLFTGSAKSRFACKPVATTSAWTDIAALHTITGGSGALLQKPLFVRTDIGRRIVRQDRSPNPQYFPLCPTHRNVVKTDIRSAFDFGFEQGTG